jgi:aminodeoxychorismate lyase
MEEGKYLLCNGKFITTGKAIISADNRGFRFGDGLFETMRMINGSVPLLNYHFERLFSSLLLLKFQLPQYFTPAYLSEQIKKIAIKNQHENSARIRLTIFRGNGGLYTYENDFPNYIIQTWKIKKQTSILNKAGIIAGVYTKARKSCDDFSHIKSNNYLPYLMAAMWAKENKFDDALILNNYNRVAEATIANIFLVKDGTIKTPAQSEGCISGVMRRFLIESFKKENIPFEETQIEVDELPEANELFLTNAVTGIRWIKQCNKTFYSKKLIEFIGNRLKF